MASVQFVIGELERLTERAVVALSVNLSANLIEATPVDTGWARANWIPSIGVRNNAAVTADADTALVPGRRNEQQVAIAALNQYTINRGSVFVTNNVPYIVRLNEGSSRQAPSAFVQGEIERTVNEVGRTIR